MFEHRGEAWRGLMMKPPPKKNARRNKGGKGVGKTGSGVGRESQNGITRSIVRNIVITKLRYFNFSYYNSNIPRPITFGIGWATPKGIACVFAFLGHSF